MLQKIDANLISQTAIELDSIRQKMGLPTGPVEYGLDDVELSQNDLRLITENLDVIAPRHFSSHRRYLGPLIVWLKSTLMNSLILRVLRKSLSRQWTLNYYIYRIAALSVDMYDRFRTTELHTKNLLAENHKLVLATADINQRLLNLAQDIASLKSAAMELTSKNFTGNPKDSSVELSALWDFYYRSFEDRFRGSEAAVREKQSSYISRICPHLSKDAVVVDLGCGRGEWLGLLKAEGFRPIGVDKNTEMLAAARKSGYDLVHADVFDWLAKQPADSVDLISAFHIVEHLTPNELLRMLSEIARVTKKSGWVLIETPNPENVVVGACNFWFDITHVKPIPPLTLGFILEFLGFEQIECIRSSPPFEGANPQNPLEAPQDYAILSRKR